MKYIFLLFFISLFSNLNSQKSSDPIYNAIEKTAFNYRDSGKLDSALMVFNQLLEYDGIDCQRIGRSYNLISNIYSKQNLHEKAKETLLNKVLPNWENCNELNKKYLTSPYGKLIRIYLTLKNPDQALYYAHKVITLYAQGNGKRIIRLIDAHRDSAAAHSMKGNYVLAKRHLDLASFLSQEQMSPKDNSIYSLSILEERVRISKDMDDFESAISYATLALSDKRNEITEFILRGNRFHSYLELGDTMSAIDDMKWLTNHYDSIYLTIDTKIQYHQLIAQYKLLNNQADSALISLEKAKLFSDSISDFSNKAVTMAGLGEAYYAKGNYELLEEYIAKAIGYLSNQSSSDILKDGIQLHNKKIYNYDDLLSILSDYLDIKKTIYNRSKSEKSVHDVIEIFDEIDYVVKSARLQYKSEFSQINQLENIYSLYGDMISWLSKMEDIKYHQKALQYCMDNKSIVLENSKNKKSKDKITLSKAENSKILKLEHSIKDIENKYLSSTGFEKDSLNYKYITTLTEIYNIEGKQPKQQSTPTTFKISQSAIPKIKSKLASDQLLIEIFLGKKELFLFFVDKSGVKIKTISVDKGLLDLLNNILLNLVTEGDPRTCKQLSSKAYNMLFKENLELRQDIKKLTIVADGVLHDLPLSTFWTGNEYMVEKYDINYLFSTNQIISESKGNSKEYLGFGTSYTSNLNSNLNTQYLLSDMHLAPLDNAGPEIENSARIMNGDKYIDSASSLSEFMNTTQNHKGILHLALHGLIIDQYNSAIIFDDREQDFLLSSNQVYNLNLNNYLSILSACYSADGTIYSGEGVRSLARAFHYAGSDNIISSQWAASDQANKAIMTNFFTNIEEGASLSSALNVAQRNYLKTASPAMQHPSNWGNMVLIGMSDNGGTGFPLLYIGFILLALIGLYFFVKKY